jgi:hypothetical protein
MEVQKKIVCPAAVYRFASMENVEEGVLSVLAREYASITRIDKIV